MDISVEKSIELMDIHSCEYPRVKICGWEIRMDIHSNLMDILRLLMDIPWKTMDISADKSMGLWISIDIYSYGFFNQFT